MNSLLFYLYLGENNEAIVCMIQVAILNIKVYSVIDSLLIELIKLPTNLSNKA